MKTLILTHCYPPDGGTFIEHRAKQINAQVLTMGRPLGFWNFVRFVNDAVGSARKYDVIEAHWLYPAGLAALIAAKLTGTPYRVYCHGTDVMMAERSWFWRLLARRVIRRAEETRCVSRFLAEKLLRIHCEAPLIVPMPVNKSIFNQAGLMLPKQSIVMIHKKNIGRYQSCYDEFINTWRHPFHPIVVITSDKHYEQKELQRIFFHAKVVVLASENEGYGLMLAEAAECGATIVGVNEGGIPEVVRKYGGLLFDGTAADLHRKIASVLQEQVVA